MLDKTKPARKAKGSRQGLSKPFQNPWLTTRHPVRMHNHQIDRGDFFQSGCRPCSHPCPFQSSSPGACLVANPLAQQAGLIGRPGEALAPRRIRGVEDLLVLMWCRHACRAGSPASPDGVWRLRGVSTLYTIVSIPARSRAACGMHAMWTRLSCRDHRDVLLSRDPLCREYMEVLPSALLSGYRLFWTSRIEICSAATHSTAGISRKMRRNENKTGIMPPCYAFNKTPCHPLLYQI